VARAGKDAPPINASLDALVAAALEAGVSVDLYAHPTGPHAFDVLDDSPRSRDILERSLAFVQRHLFAPTR
jgi:dienelactone hydrolase